MQKNINILTGSKVVSSEISEDKVMVEIESKDKNLELISNVVLSAVGIKSNISRSSSCSDNYIFGPSLNT